MADAPQQLRMGALPLHVLTAPLLKGTVRYTLKIPCWGKLAQVVEHTLDIPEAPPQKRKRVAAARGLGRCTGRWGR